MTQSRTLSLVEAVANVMVGYGVALGTQALVFPAVGLQVTLGQNLIIGSAFSAVSAVRSYLLRRLFERLRRPERSAAAPAGRRP